MTVCGQSEQIKACKTHTKRRYGQVSAPPATLTHANTHTEVLMGAQQAVAYIRTNSINMQMTTTATCINKTFIQPNCKTVQMIMNKYIKKKGINFSLKIMFHPQGAKAARM